MHIVKPKFILQNQRNKSQSIIKNNKQETKAENDIAVNLIFSCINEPPSGAATRPFQGIEAWKLEKLHWGLAVGQRYKKAIEVKRKIIV